MTTNVIMPELAAFGERMASRLRVATKAFRIRGTTCRLPSNPLAPETPVFLVPLDVLRELPIATDWDGVGAAAAQAEELRERVNQHIAAIWEAQARRSKSDLKAEALASRESFEALLDALHGVKPKAYSVDEDPSGVLAWADRLAVASQFPVKLALADEKARTVDDVLGVVRAIVEQFKTLIERNGLWRDLWNGKRRRPEKASQRLFFAVAQSYCAANGLDVSPETDAGFGPVDFKVSAGSKSKVLVEIKLSSNSKLVPGYTNQLEAYKAAERTLRAIYLVVEVGDMGTKGDRLLAVERQARGSGAPTSEIVFVDGSRRRSASNL